VDVQTVQFTISSSDSKETQQKQILLLQDSNVNITDVGNEWGGGSKHNQKKKEIELRLQQQQRTAATA
jgi:hypothetical protein